MNYSGTLKRDVNALKAEFGKIACNYQIYSNENTLNVEITGEDENLEQALKLFTELLLIPKLEQDKLELLVNRELSSRYGEKKYLRSVSLALREFVKYGDKSRYIDRLSLEKLKDLDAGYLVGDYQKATDYAVKVHYCGSKDFNTAKEIISKNLVFKSDLKNKATYYNRDIRNIEKDKVYFINDKDAVQSSIYLFVNGEEFSKDNFTNSGAFNYYFGGGFSGIVIQEIRENKSLAYGAGASYQTPDFPNKKAYLVGSTSTQADKTVEAIKTFLDLIKNMPQKPERIKTIKSYLIQSASSQRPYFRSLGQVYSQWEKWGFKEDPNKEFIDKYKKLTFNNIVDFYNKNIKGKPIAICLVGNKKSINLKKLKKTIDVVSLNKSKIFK